MTATEIEEKARKVIEGYCIEDYRIHVGKDDVILWLPQKYGEPPFDNIYDEMADAIGEDLRIVILYPDNNVSVNQYINTNYAELKSRGWI